MFSPSFLYSASLSDEELDIYLLQLVSAIKWEPGFEKPDDFVCILLTGVIL